MHVCTLISRLCVTFVSSLIVHFWSVCAKIVHYVFVFPEGEFSCSLGHVCIRVFKYHNTSQTCCQFCVYFWWGAVSQRSCCKYCRHWKLSSVCVLLQGIEWCLSALWHSVYRTIIRIFDGCYSLTQCIDLNLILVETHNDPQHCWQF